MGVANYFGAAGATRENLIKAGRSPLFAYLKQLIAYHMYKDGYTMTYISELLGYKDHTTVVYAVRRITELLEIGDYETTRMVDLYEYRLSKYR